MEKRIAKSEFLTPFSSHHFPKNGFFASFLFRYTKWVKSFTLLRLHDEAFIFDYWLQVKFPSFVNLKMLKTGQNMFGNHVF